MSYLVFAPDANIGRTRWLVRHEQGGGAILCNTEGQASVIAWALSCLANGQQLAAGPLAADTLDALTWYDGPLDGILEPTYYIGPR